MSKVLPIVQVCIAFAIFACVNANETVNKGIKETSIETMSVIEQQIIDPESGKVENVLNVLNADKLSTFAKASAAGKCKVRCRGGRRRCRSTCGINANFCCCLRCRW